MLNNSLHAISLGVCALLFSLPVCAQEGLPVDPPAKCLASNSKMTPAKCLVGYAQTRFVVCSFSMTGLRLGLKAAPECNVSGPGSLTEHYEATLAAFEGNAPAQAMTKDYYAYWLTAMRSVMPGAEREAAWRARADKLQFELAEKGNRLMLEK